MYSKTWIRWLMTVVLFIGVAGFVFADESGKTEKRIGNTSFQMMSSRMGPGMMGSRMMDPGEMREHHALAERPLISFMLQHKAELKLTSEQIEKLEALRTDFRKEAIKKWSDLQIAEVELDTLLQKEPIDLAQVETKTKQIADLQADIRLARIKTLEQGKTLLSPEQRSELEKLSQTEKPTMGASEWHMMSQDDMYHMMQMMEQMHSMMGSQRGMMAPSRGHMSW